MKLSGTFGEALNGRVSDTIPTAGSDKQQKNKTRNKEWGAEQKRRFWYKGERGYHKRSADRQQKASASPACDNPEDEAKNSRADLYL